MRPIERIPIILDAINFEEFLKDAKVFDEDTINTCILAISQNWKELREFWEANPYLRLFQVLINGGFLPNLPGFYYYKEETDYCIEKGYLQPRDIYFWGSYGKDGKGPLKWISIKKMETDHLKACLDTQTQMKAEYRKVMLEELKLRKEEIKPEWCFVIKPQSKFGNFLN